MIPGGLFNPPAVTLTKLFEIPNEISTQMYTNLDSDSLNNIDHMRILDTEP